MVNFIIPGMYELSELNINLLAAMDVAPELFEDKAKIGAVFGNFQFNIWDGGRIFQEYRQTSKEEVEYLQKMYNEKFHVPMRFVFTNNQITEKDCYDRFNNLILTICQNDLNEIVISSPLLYDYIKTEYPQYKFISSTTKNITNPELALAEIKDEKYSMVCLDYNLNKNWKFLNSIPEEYKPKTEFLINAICPPGCKTRKSHYKLNSIFSLSYGKKYALPTCEIYTNTLDPILEKGNNLSRDDIYGKYSEAGFSNFKIEGRTLTPLEISLNYAKYFIKPEYNSYIINGLNSYDVNGLAYNLKKMKKRGKI